MSMFADLPDADTLWDISFSPATVRCNEDDERLLDLSDDDLRLAVEEFFTASAYRRDVGAFFDQVSDVRHTIIGIAHANAAHNTKDN